MIVIPNKRTGHVPANGFTEKIKISKFYLYFRGSADAFLESF